MRLRRLLPTALAGACLLPAAAAAQGPPPPTAVSGAAVETVGAGVPSPVGFAFGHGKVFVASGGAEDGSAPGGVFVAGGGTATKISNSPAIAFGLAYRKGVLYVSSGRRLLGMSGWNGTGFKKTKVLYKGAKRFPGFGGLAFGHDGRLYAGVTISNFKYDSRKSPQPYAQSIVSMKPNGKDIRTVAVGLREPWQLTFVKGIDDPFVSVLGQDNLKQGPPDYIIRARKGQNYGFPKCNWNAVKPCKPFAKPFRLLPAHSSPMGMGSIGKTLYVALFGRAEVDTLKLPNGRRKPFLTKFAAPVVGLGIHKGYVYAGDLTGTVYRVKA
jgi:glucose/arabinose dehydrogenase